MWNLTIFKLLASLITSSLFRDLWEGTASFESPETVRKLCFYIKLRNYKKLGEITAFYIVES